MNSQLKITPDTDSTVILTVLGDQPYPTFEVKNILRYLDEHHPLFSQKLLAQTGIEPSQLNEPFLPAYKVLSVMQNCSDYRGALMGARIGQTYKTSDLGVFGYALSSSQTLSTALQICDKYDALIGSLLEKSTHIEGEHYLVRMHNVQNLEKNLLAFYICLGLSANIQVSREVFGDDLSYSKIYLTWDDSENRAEYEALFGCQIEFGADFNGWALPLSDLERQVSQESNASFATYLPYCNELLESMKQKDSLVNEIQQILISCAGDYPDIEMLACAFNVSSRTLRRQLASLGTSYQRILNKVRCQLAIEYLTRTETSIEDISNLIGFSDVTNFRHAFKKWVGKTPSFYRKSYSGIDRICA